MPNLQCEVLSTLGDCQEVLGEARLQKEAYEQGQALCIDATSDR